MRWQQIRPNKIKFLYMKTYLLFSKKMAALFCAAILLLIFENPLQAQVYNKGNMYISGNVYVKGDIENSSTASYFNNGFFYLDGSFKNDQAGMAYGTPTSSGTLILQGNNAVTRLNGAENFFLNNLTLSKTTTTNLVFMYKNVFTKKNLTLVKGIITTGANLFTWENTGTISMPGTGLGESGGATLYTDSYIATCDSMGIPITDGASATTPYNGNLGFRIINLANTDTYFPIGATYIPAITGGIPSPNRMMLNNYSAAANFTVIVNIGDIGKTVVNGVSTTWHVNRIWYVKTNAPLEKGMSNMRLFFTKRTTGLYPSTQNEVEYPGFDYAQCALVQKNYEPLNNGFIALAQGADRKNFVGALTNTEIYGEYTNISKPTRIDSFTRFSVVNPGAIVLPVTITDLKAAANGHVVDLTWTSLNEINIDKYTVERSGDAVNFIGLGNVEASDNNEPENKYAYTDSKPLNGSNFYRVKVWEKDGATSYTNTVKINFSDNNPNGFRVYPNPVQNKHFTLDMNNLAVGKYTLILTAINGQRVFEKAIEYTGGRQSLSFDLPRSIAAGTYNLLLKSGDFTGRVKLVVE